MTSDVSLSRPGSFLPTRRMSHFTRLRSRSCAKVGHCLLALLFAPASLLADFREFKAVAVDGDLGAKITRTAEASLKDLPRLTADNLALSVIDVTKPDLLARGDYHGDASFYPASLVKLFFMVETYRRGKLTPEIERALREMISVSDNDAAAFLVDILTDTCSGSELEGKALQDFIDRRRKLNRAFASLGYEISAMMKPWSFGPFGRDLQALGPNKANRNRGSATPSPRSFSGSFVDMPSPGKPATPCSPYWNVRSHRRAPPRTR